MIAQAVVTVAAGKRLIAQSLTMLPDVRQALANGKIVLKAGTTVSAFGELIGVPPMRLGGRLVEDGARGPRVMADSPHIALVEKGKWRTIDGELVNEALSLGPGDLFITGANALDSHGIAGLLTGIEGGSAAGRSLSSLWAEGVPTIIAAGLEKMIPGSIIEICQMTGRKKVDKAMGMATGMVPLFGRIITEREALNLLTGVSATVLASGGISGAEGCVLLLLEGSPEQIDFAFKLIQKYRNAPCSGHPDTVTSCSKGGPACKNHRACIYKPT